MDVKRFDFDFDARSRDGATISPNINQHGNFNEVEKEYTV